jgi:hypothetical protein
MKCHHVLAQVSRRVANVRHALLQLNRRGTSKWDEQEPGTVEAVVQLTVGNSRRGFTGSGAGNAYDTCSGRGGGVDELLLVTIGTKGHGSDNWVIGGFLDESEDEKKTQKISEAFLNPGWVTCTTAPHHHHRKKKICTKKAAPKNGL